MTHSRTATPYLVAILLLLLVMLAGCSRPARAEPTPTPVPTQAPLRIAMAPHIAPVSQTNAQEESLGEVETAAQADMAQLLPDRMTVSTLEMDIPVVEIGWSQKKDYSGSVYSAWDEADYAAGWHKNSATPGAGGNIVLSGHNNVRGAVFRELDLLERGDLIEIYVEDEAHTYQVDRILIVPERDASEEQQRVNAQFIAPTASEQLTLVSCWPRDNNTHRIIVIAYPVDGEQLSATSER